VVCERKGTFIKPFDVVPKLASGELTPEAWQGFCVGAEISDLDLGGGCSILRKLRHIRDQDELPNIKAPLVLLTAFNMMPILSTRDAHHGKRV
jgi:hypothetical protein